ncbi:phosphatidylinositol transfer protein csr1 [Coemansia sp. RSA 1972]|nr:phosphatidylinositol transfer protein csr1 [Coemansia sp. RSA 1972]
MDAPLLEHYKSKEPVTCGHVGALTKEEANKLRQLWQLVIDEFDRTDSEPLRVLFRLGDSDAAYEDGGLTSLSFEPLVSLSSKDRAQSESAIQTMPEPERQFESAMQSELATKSESTTPNNAPLSNRLARAGSGFLGWMSSGRSTPASTASASDTAQAQQRRHESVQDHVQRTHEHTKSLVPAPFVPLFGQPEQTRTFRAAFWQAATQTRDADSWLLRFLRARKWDTRAAFAMLRKTLEWRTGQAIDEIMFYGESQLHMHTMESGLAFACTRDRLDNPVFVIRVRANMARERSIAAIKRFLCWQIETSQLLASRVDGRVTLVFDMSGFTRDNVDLQLMRTLVTLLTNYYPESLGIMLMYANSLMFAGLWALIAPFIDSSVKDKIILVRNASGLAPFIDRKCLPVELGGSKAFKYEYVVPKISENTCMGDVKARGITERSFGDAVNAYERATRTWLERSSDDVSVDAGQDRDSAREAVCKAADALDPYVRARTLYHRLGLI